MPNKRKAGKKQAGAWVQKDLYDALKGKADAAGVSVSDLVIRMIEQGLGFDPRDSTKGKKCTDGKV
jgi:hypothetical protein